MQLEHAREDLKPEILTPPSLVGRLAALRDRWLPKEGTRITARILGRPVRVELSPAAVEAAAKLAAPLTVEMELYFSCLVRKAVRFRNADADPALPDGSHTALLDRLGLQFRPVTTKHCPLDQDAPPLEAMPIMRPQAFVPRWVRVDVHNGEWIGDFGY